MVTYPKGGNVVPRSKTAAPALDLGRREFCFSVLAGAASTLLARPLEAQALPGTVTLQAAGKRRVPVDYAGFSCETMQLADPSFFASSNRFLVSLFRSLSPRGVLRIGGNTSEFCWWQTKPDQKPPADPSSAGQGDNWMPHNLTAIQPAGVDNLAGFLDATGWKAIYGLNLGTGTPERAAEESAYVARTLGSRLMFFQIGNEPEFYRDANNGLRAPGWNFEQYLAQWVTFARAVIERVPEARFGGPDVGSDGSWVVRFAQEAPKLLPGRIVSCSGHYYAEGPPDSPSTTMARLLAPDPHIDRDLARIIKAADMAGIDYRMTEGNSCYRGGKPGMSNAFCSALWAADYMLKLASYGCAGVNLHGGGAAQIRQSLGGHLPGEKMDPGAAELAKEGSFYTPIAGSRETGFKARPVFYGMKLADLLAGGRMRAVNLGVAGPAATAYAADMEDGKTRIVVINKDASSDLPVRIASRHGAKIWRLEAPSLNATTGVTLAGATIDAAQPWKPKREEHVASQAGFVTIKVSAASAVAIFFSDCLA
jgi:hypothetical protein